MIGGLAYIFRKSFVFRLFPSIRKNASKPSSARRGLTFESLENRELLSANHFSTNAIEETPNDPQISEQWGLSTVNIAEAWKHSDGTGAVVAVLDSGTTLSHPDLKDNLWKNTGEVEGDGIDNDGNGWIDDLNGWNFVDDNNDVADNDGHGTHVSGIIGATANNGQGGCGVAPGVQLLTVKVIAGSNGATSCIVAGLDYVIGLKQSGVNIVAVNMSLGYSIEDAAVAQKMQQAGTEGIVVVCSAGNNTNDNDAKPHYPSHYSTMDNVLAAGSTDKTGKYASNSNYGVRSVNLAAPGVSIYSTIKDGTYGNMSGTSMAAPFVTGAAAILAMSNPTWSAAQIKTAILDAVRHSSALDAKTASGGILNVGAVFVPQEPTGTLTVIAESSSSVRLSWDAVDNAKRYVIERSNDKTRWTMATTSATATEIVVKGLKPASSYFFRLKTVMPDGTDEITEPAEVQTLLKSVEGLRLTIEDNSVRLRWAAVADAAGYRIERSVRDSEEWTTVEDLPEGTTEYFDAVSMHNTELLYRITALSSDGTFDALSSKTRTILTPPMPPNIVNVVQALDKQITLSWEESPGALRYQVERFNNGRWGVVASARTTTVIVRNLRPETEYQFRVVAVGKNGKSFAEDPVFASTTVAVPAAPPHLKVRALDTDMIFLTWEQANRAENYLVHRYTYDDKTWEDLNTTTALQYLDTGLSEGTRYAYEVIAFNAGGSSKNAAKGQTLTFQSSDGADYPANVTLITATSRSLKFSWELESSRPLSYRIQWATEMIEDTTELLWSNQKKVTLQPLRGETVLTLGGLQPETLYFVRIRVEMPNLTSDWSDVAEMSTQ